ncbi:hypothetical protein ACLOJK_027128 [Asimina triloba]
MRREFVRKLHEKRGGVDIYLNSAVEDTAQTDSVFEDLVDVNDCIVCLRGCAVGYVVNVQHDHLPHSRLFHLLSLSFYLPIKSKIRPPFYRPPLPLEIKFLSSFPIKSKISPAISRTPLGIN